MKRRPMGKRMSKKVFHRGNRVNRKNGLDSTANGLYRGGIRF